MHILKMVFETQIIKKPPYPVKTAFGTDRALGESVETVINENFDFVPYVVSMDCNSAGSIEETCLLFFSPIIVCARIADAVVPCNTFITYVVHRF